MLQFLPNARHWCLSHDCSSLCLSTLRHRYFQVSLCWLCCFRRQACQQVVLWSVACITVTMHAQGVLARLFCFAMPPCWVQQCMHLWCHLLSLLHCFGACSSNSSSNVASSSGRCTSPPRSLKICWAASDILTFLRGFWYFYHAATCGAVCMLSAVCPGLLTYRIFIWAHWAGFQW